LQLDGRVEIDDTYLGRERVEGKSGRGSENKVSAKVEVDLAGSADVGTCIRTEVRGAESRS
jgi:hypothetical protein